MFLCAWGEKCGVCCELAWKKGEEGVRGERDETLEWTLLLSLEIFASICLSVNLWSIEAHANMSPVHLFMERSFLYSSESHDGRIAESCENNTTAECLLLSGTAKPFPPLRRTAI
ncbi:hypothetical protein BHE74_00053461 [Ensete ventricosum]|nr:hypothetical protein BHE74_00053461 [Ensete ventricosum]RZS15198.1 hypothetical protein BHM03_00047008 [Ensete ventricosum]